MVCILPATQLRRPSTDPGKKTEAAMLSTVAVNATLLGEQKYGLFHVREISVPTYAFWSLFRCTHGSLTAQMVLCTCVCVQVQVHVHMCVHASLCAHVCVCVCAQLSTRPR